MNSKAFALLVILVCAAYVANGYERLPCDYREICGPDKYWSVSRCECVCRPKPCPAPKTWDPSTCQCSCTRTCHGSYELDRDTCTCKCALSPDICYPRYILNSHLCKCRCPYIHCPYYQNPLTCKCYYTLTENEAKATGHQEATK